MRWICLAVCLLVGFSGAAQTGGGTVYTEATLQSAIGVSGNSGGTATLAPGTYSFGSTLNITQPFTIQGASTNAADTVINCSGAGLAQFIKIATTGAVGFRNLTIHGLGCATAVVQNTTAPTASITFDNVTVDGGIDESIVLSDVQNLYIRNGSQIGNATTSYCRSRTCYGLYVTTASYAMNNFVLDQSTFNCSAETTYNFVCVYLNPGNEYSVSNVVVTGNMCTSPNLPSSESDCFVFGSSLATHTAAQILHATVSNNQLTGVGTAADTRPEIGIQNAGMLTAVISGNNITNLNNPAIMLENCPSTPTGPQGSFSQMITGNSINSASYAGSSAVAILVASSTVTSGANPCSNVLVTGNQGVGPGNASSFLSFQAGGGGSAIANASLNYYFPMYLATTGNVSLEANNFGYSLGSTEGANSQCLHDQFAGTQTGLLVKGNFCEGFEYGLVVNPTAITGCLLDSNTFSSVAIPYDGSTPLVMPTGCVVNDLNTAFSSAYPRVFTQVGTGSKLYITDAMTPSYGGTYTGGGAVAVMGVWNGTSWITQ
jgi:hypothetical protein